MTVRSAIALLVALAWAGVMTGVFALSFGSDLASIYMAAVFAGLDRADLVYDYDPSLFTDVAAPEWAAEAVRRGVPAPDKLHPYVQPPIWAVLLAPLALALPFGAFKAGALALMHGCLLGAALLVRRLWLPAMGVPACLGAAILLLSLSWPYIFSMLFAQIQPLVVLLMLLALERDAAGRPASAGFAFAAAVALKLSPAALGLYFLVCGRWPTLAWSALFAAAWVLATLLLVEGALIEAFLARIRGLSGQIVLGSANASLQAALTWLAEGGAYDYRLRPAPDWLSAASAAALLGLVGGAALRWRGAEALRRRQAVMPVALLAATLLAPLAWIHYLTLAVLILPVLVPLWGRGRGLLIGAAAFALMTAPLPLVIAGLGGDEDAWPGTALLPLAGALLVLLACLFAPRRDPERASLIDRGGVLQ